MFQFQGRAVRRSVIRDQHPVENLRPVKSFGNNTYENCRRNPFRISTYQTKDLKPLRINTYRSTPGGCHPVGAKLAPAYHTEESVHG
jgi:hypothetical protein